MKSKIIPIIIYSAIVLFAFVFQSCYSQQSQEPWQIKQLMEPSELAKMLQEDNTKDMYIYSIGPSGLIKNAIDIGECKEESNVKKLKKAVSKLPKDANIVLYCGCCPFKDCPNVRPAFKLLNEMEFTNHKLLNLSKNLKADWLDNQYPMSE